jgi:O-antigen ligase
VIRKATGNRQQATGQPLLVWKFTQFGVLILPFISSLSATSLVLAFSLIWKQGYRRLLQYPTNWGFLLFSFWLIVTSCFAFKPGEAFLGLPNFLPFLALLTASPLLIQTPAQLRRLAWLFVIPSLVVVILGLGQLFLGWQTAGFLTGIGLDLVAKGNPEGRMSSVFLYANTLSAYLIVTFILGLGLWLDTFRIWRRQLSQQDSWMLGLLSITIFADGIGLILTNSRNAWGISLIACLAFALYLGWRWLVLGIVAAASPVIWASWGPSPGREWLREIVPIYFWGRLSDELYPHRPLASLRVSQWQFAWQMTIEHPWLGWGLRNFTPLYQEKTGLFLGHPHNLFLMLLAEIGIPGTVLLCFLIGWMMVKSIYLLRFCFGKSSQLLEDNQDGDSLIFFTYLIAFTGLILFNLFDVSIFDLKVNLMAWVVLSGIYGIILNNLTMSDLDEF